MDQHIKYLKLCDSMIADVADNRLSIVDAAAKLSRDIVLQKRSHPMLHSIFNIAWDIAECYDHLESIQENWGELVELVGLYKAGDWENSRWLLIASFVKKNGEGDVVAGYGLTIGRINGLTTISAASKPIKEAAGSIVAAVNNRQTDEWFLRNVAYKTPSKIDGLEVQEITISDGSTNLPLTLP